MGHRLSREARTDLDELWFYVADQRSIESADRLVDSVVARFVLLAKHMRAGRRRDDLRPGTRAFPIGEYLILYPSMARTC
jgi:plasmid stabilization system protein ParE